MSDVEWIILVREVFAAWAIHARRLTFTLLPFPGLYHRIWDGCIVVNACERFDDREVKPCPSY